MAYAATQSSFSLSEMVLREFGGDGRAVSLCHDFENHRDPEQASFHDHILDLIRTARGGDGSAWPVRRLAALMLERQIVLALGNCPERAEALLVALGLKAPETDHVHEWLLREGFTTTKGIEFAGQLLRKLQRRNETLRTQNLSHREWQDLFHRARQDCRLALARYLFDPADVVDQVVAQVAVSDGVRDQTRVGPAGEQHVDAPPYETAIIEGLARGSRIFWVKDATSSGINSLAEFPLGTVALAIKAPGSDREIEIKRAGMRRRPLDVLFEEGIHPVPYSHRVQGGSPGWMLLAEARRAAYFRSFYRAVHGVEPAMSRIVATAHVHAVPAENSQIDLLTYFTDPSAFGQGFERMRSQMRYCVENLVGRPRRPAPEGELALTVAFLRDLKPRQSIVLHTSSFRLDVLQKYLSPDGPESYFSAGLKTEFTDDDARRFADDLIEEVLGSYVPPGGPYPGYAEYIGNALAQPENRAAADMAYEFCMRQVGTYWGTLLAAGGYSTGESFVARNVGLKSSWIGGHWRVSCIFMDHDSLFCPDPNDRDFPVEAFLKGAFLDQRYVFGSIREEDSVLGSVECLQSIYRVDPATARKGEEMLCDTMAAAYKQVRRQMLPGGELRGLLSDRLIESLVHFDEIVRMSLEGGASWQTHAQRRLTEWGYGEQLSEQFVALIEKHQSFLRWNEYLFRESEPVNIPHRA